VTDESWTIAGVASTLSAAFGGILWQSRTTQATTQDALDAANAALEAERRSCTARIAAVESRCDKLWEIVMEGGGNGGS